MRVLRWAESGWDVRLDGTLLVCGCRECGKQMVFSAAFSEDLVEACLQEHRLDAHPEMKVVEAMEIEYLDALAEGRLS